jgi:hypothetical protein
MKPSLLRHTGCDIIDINPGVGVWSSAVHELLKPRNHYLMEPDHELYTPLLQPLLVAKCSTYRLIPKSGAVWAQLNNLLSPASLPQQVEYETGDPRLDKPNDSLLVLANLSWFPKKPFRAFPSASLLVINQLLSAARAHSLFHRYGLIRMLIWAPDDEGKKVLPRNISGRRKMAVEAEVTCSEIFEIASSSVEHGKWKRDEEINIESARKVLKKMEDAGISTPKCREGKYQLQATKLTREQISGDDQMAVHRKFHDELEKLQKNFAAGHFTKYADGSIPLNPGEEREEHDAEIRRLRTLRRWYERTEKQKGVPPQKGKLLAEFNELQARLRSRDVEGSPEDDGGEATSQAQIIRPNLASDNPDWKRLRYLQSWYKSCKKRTGKAPTAGKRTLELEALQAKFEAGGIKKYLESDPFLRSIMETTSGGLIKKQQHETRKNALQLSKEYKRMRILEARLNTDKNQLGRIGPLIEKMESITEMQKKLKTLEGTDAEDLQKQINDCIVLCHEEIANIPTNDADFMLVKLDNRRTFDNEPPILYWDRREAEPLLVKPEEFYPKTELCLLDFHPQPLWPVLRKDFPAAYDVFEYILATLFLSPSQAVKPALKGLSPGAYEWLVVECPSLTDVTKGGFPDLELMTVRCLTLEMLREITEAFVRWPWRPDRFELMKMSVNTVYDPDKGEEADLGKEEPGLS